ncbi:DUF3159 domain-containing protein [Streptomyces monticola]|uniref:DUF3159 domain-containing protein n=1 Tax=Streptomyces monticola TaxID=2666263 RepID=A0ABW2JB36_9ACTN
MTSVDKPTDHTTPGQAGGPDGQAGAPGGDAKSADGGSKAVTEAALFEAFGGLRGMVETVLPGLLFVTIYTINKDLHLSAIAALGVSLLLVVVRLVMRDTVKHAFSGVFGVAFGVVFAMMTGNAKDFYLPGMLYTLGLGIAYIVTTLAGAPLIGLILGPVFKENLSWRTRNPGRKKAYAKASYAWGAILLAKCAILFPLYWWADTEQLGWVLVALKIPPFLLAVWLTWVFLAKAPAPIDVFAEMEAAEAAEKAEKERKKTEAAFGEQMAPVVDETLQRLVEDQPKHRKS